MKKEEKIKSNSWFNQDFINEFSNESLKNSMVNAKSENFRSKSLSSRTDQESFINELNIASTNQTSLEISIEEITIPQNDKAMQKLQKTSGSVPKMSELRKSSSKKLGNKFLPIFSTKKPKSKGNKPHVSDELMKFKPSKGKKTVVKQYLNRENTISSSNGTGSSRKGSETKGEVIGSDKFKNFVPILSAKGTQRYEKKCEVGKTKGKKSELQENLKKFKGKSKSKEKFEEESPKLEENNKISNENSSGSVEEQESMQENEGIGYDFIDNFEFQLIQKSNEINSFKKENDMDYFIFPVKNQLEVKPQFNLEDAKKRNFPNFYSPISFTPPTIFTSPLRNVKKMQNVKKSPENPYESHEIPSEIIKNLENLQKKLIFTDSSSQNSLRSLESLENNLLEIPQIYEKRLNAIREPSFGFGGGEFEYKETKNQENLIYYDPEIINKDQPKEIQTEDNLEFLEKNFESLGKNLENPEKTEFLFRNIEENLLKSAKSLHEFENFGELVKLISDEEFVKSLKIIGKFAKFLEINCKS